MSWTAPPFELHEPYFEGGFARVYKATHPDRPNKLFAVKFPKDPSVPIYVKRLKREARVLSEIDHPNVLALVESSLEASPPFLVLEYMTGGCIADLLKQGPMGFAASVLLLRQMAGALAAFHARGGFHRDVKPENILIAPDGSFVLSDANLAGVPHDASIFTRTVAGTPGYIDPWVANRSYDAAADIWSLAVTTIKCLLGEQPDSDDLQAGNLELSEADAPSDQHRDGLSRLLKSMMRADRTKRPAADTVHKFANVLLTGGRLPQLPVVTASPRPRQNQPGLGAFLTGAGLVGLLFVGIAALTRDD